MLADRLAYTALVILGHGTTLHPGSEKPVYQHVAALRERRLFATVREAFWKQSPFIQHVMAELNQPRVIIVPFFLTEGYFSDELIPRELGFPNPQQNGARTLLRGSQTFIYTRPLGAHESMAEIVLARARAVVAQFPFPRAPEPRHISLFLAGHGTERNANSRKRVEAEVAAIRERNLYASVDAVFLEEAPRIPEVYGLAASRHVVVVPHFLSDGLHVQEDIPVLLGEPEGKVRERLAQNLPPFRNPTQRKEKLVWYSSSLGSEPKLADTILCLAEEAALDQKR